MAMQNNVTIINGNIFNTKAQTIVNTVNCVGVMGKGIALVFKLRYPVMFEQYQEYCKQKLIAVGKLWIYKGETSDPWILNFPTKTHWKLPSEYKYIEEGLQKFVDTYKAKGITSIAFPLLGANNGGLDKDKVMEIMYNYLSKCDIPVEIYQYDPSAPDDLFETFKCKWNEIPNVDKKKQLGIRQQRQIDTIDRAVNIDNVKSMIALIEYKGIGLTTILKCFRLVMNYQKVPTLDL